MPEGFKVEQTEAWDAGLVEVQDEGSQLICPRQRDKAGHAGGRSLRRGRRQDPGACRRHGRAGAPRRLRYRPWPALPHPARVSSGPESPSSRRACSIRGRRSRRCADLAGQADLVLVDAPCSGTGTWRRNPETRWRVTPGAARTGCVSCRPTCSIIGAQLVRPGGFHGLCRLLAAGRGGQEPGRSAGRPFIAGSGAAFYRGGTACRPRNPAQPGPGRYGRLFRRTLATPSAKRGACKEMEIIDAPYADRPLARHSGGHHGQRRFQPASRRPDRPALGRPRPASPAIEHRRPARRSHRRCSKPRWRSIRATAAPISHWAASPRPSICRARRSASTAMRSGSSPTTSPRSTGQGEAYVQRGAIERARANLARVRTLCAQPCPQARSSPP